VVVDWSSVGAAVLALVGVVIGVVVGAIQRRGDREAQVRLREADVESRRLDWEREHRRVLYVAAAALLRDVGRAGDEAWNRILDPAGFLGARLSQLGEIVQQAEIIASHDTLQALRRIHQAMLRQAWRARMAADAGGGSDGAGPALGRSSATRRLVEEAIASMRRDLGIKDPPGVNPPGLSTPGGDA
jgi:hypothetical protein